MSSYFQMGHNTENLVAEEGLDMYAGIVLSPVNRSPDELGKHIEEFKSKGEFDIVLDPQLYFPKSERGAIQGHPHFPKDFETADLTNIGWWKDQNNALAEYATELDVTSVASPCFVPKIWANEYYVMCADLADDLRKKLSESGVRVWTTVIAAMSELSNTKRAREIASILSRKMSDGYYIVFVSPMDPRRELADEKELLGALVLLRELRITGRPILVSHCSSDMALFKYAGADHCATGKFFNLRRFSSARYEEPSSGGGQLPYWFAQSLMAFLRQADILRLQENGHAGMVTAGHSGNEWGTKILEQLTEPDPPAWVAFGWRQYLSWFGKAELELSENGDVLRNWLKVAEANWLRLEDEEVLFDETRNDGAWIRSWRQCMSGFDKDAGA